jgi:hypothetical protein
VTFLTKYKEFIGVKSKWTRNKYFVLLAKKIVLIKLLIIVQLFIQQTILLIYLSQTGERRLLLFVRDLRYFNDWLDDKKKSVSFLLSRFDFIMISFQLHILYK